MSNRNKLINIALCLFMISNLGFADSEDETRENSRKKMRYYFSQTFKSMKALEYHRSSMLDADKSMDEDDKAVYDLNQDWFLKAFLIRVRPFLGFDLPGTWSLKIVPEAEVYWTQF